MCILYVYYAKYVEFIWVLRNQINTGDMKGEIRT